MNNSRFFEQISQYNSSSAKISTFSSFLRSFSNFESAFYPVYHRNMANFKNSFDPSKTISVQIQLYCFLSDLFWIVALAYCIVTSTFFAQISLFFVIEYAFYLLVALAFRAFKFFIHAFILHCISALSNTRSGTAEGPTGLRRPAV